MKILIVDDRGEVVASATVKHEDMYDFARNFRGNSDHVNDHIMGSLVIECLEVNGLEVSSEVI